MKYIFFGFVSLISIFHFFSFSDTFAETTSVFPIVGTSSGTPETSTTAALKLISIQTEDDMHISVTFSSPVDLTTLKLKIIKQSDNSALKILSLSGVMNTPTTTRINLETNLIPSTAYTLTVISAVGNDGSVIRDGALALKEFVTSASLQKYEDILNAAPNPNAILVQSGMNPVPSVVTPAPKTTPIPTISPVIKKDPILVVKELPLTGMNPFFLLIIILPLVLFFVRRKRQS